MLTVAGAIAAFSTFSAAQDTKTDTPSVSPERTEKSWRKDGKGRGGRFGQGFGRKHGHHGMRGFMKGITLTDAQKDQIKAIRESNRPDQATMDEMRGLMKAKHEGTLTADQEARIKTLREQRMTKGKAVHEQIMNVFTADQKAQIEKNKVEMKQRREEMKLKREEFRKQKQADGTADKPKVG